MLLAVLIHAKTFESQIARGAIVGLHGTGQEEWGLHIEILHAVLHHGQLDGDDAGHLDRATEADLPIALREVQITDAEFRSGDVHGEEGPAAAGQVLDVAVAAVLGAAGDRPRAFLADFRFQVALGGSGVHVLRLGGLGHNAFQLGGADEVGFAAVPLCEDFG